MDRCEARYTTPTGDLEVDIVGPWMSCMDTIDTNIPWCVFREDGTLVLVGRQDAFIPGTGEVRRLDQGESVTWTYSVDGERLSVFTDDGQVYYDRLNVADNTHLGITFGEVGLKWTRASCTGPSFEW